MQSRGSGGLSGGNLGEAKAWAEQRRQEGSSGCESRIGVMRAKGSGELGKIKGMKLSVFLFIRLLISHPHFKQLVQYFSRTFPHPPLLYFVALDSGSDSRYVRRQGREI